MLYEGCSIYFWPNNGNANIYHQKWFYCFSKYSPAWFIHFCAQTTCRSTFSIPIETSPKHAFWTLQQHRLTTKIVDHEFSYLFGIWKKGILTLVTGGWNLRNNRDRYRHVCIYILDQEEKIKLFQKMSVRPSVRPCAKVMYTKTQERVNIIECGFFVWKVYTGNRNCQNFDPNARRLTKLEPNEIFNDFAISRAPFDEIDSNYFLF